MENHEFIKKEQQRKREQKNYKTARKQLARCQIKSTPFNNYLKCKQSKFFDPKARMTELIKEDKRLNYTLPIRKSLQLQIYT